MTTLTDVHQFTAVEIDPGLLFKTSWSICNRLSKVVTSYNRPFVDDIVATDFLTDVKSKNEIRHALLESSIDSKGSSSNPHWSRSLIVCLQEEITTVSAYSEIKFPTMSLFAELEEKFTKKDQPSGHLDTELSDLLASVKPKTENCLIGKYDPDRKIFKIKHLTGFDWSELANLLNVEKKNLVDWMQGDAVPDENRKHIENTLQVIKIIDRGTSEVNLAELKREIKGLNPLDEIKKGNYTVAIELIGFGTGRTETDKSERGWIGDYRPMLEHKEADGTEEPPMQLSEPKLATRRRTVRRY